MRTRPLTELNGEDGFMTKPTLVWPLKYATLKLQSFGVRSFNSLLFKDDIEQFASLSIIIYSSNTTHDTKMKLCSCPELGMESWLLEVCTQVHNQIQTKKSDNN